MGIPDKRVYGLLRVPSWLPPTYPRPPILNAPNRAPGGLSAVLTGNVNHLESQFRGSSGAS
jgi:hypothetical protein